MDLIDVIIPILPVCGLLIIVMALGVSLNALWLKLMLRNIRACPECGAKAAGEIIDTKEIILSNHVDHRGRKPVRIKESKIIDHYQCEVCEHTWERSFTHKERIRMDDVYRK
jgi:hypothetical protein